MVTAELADLSIAIYGVPWTGAAIDKGKQGHPYGDRQRGAAAQSKCYLGF